MYAIRGAVANFPGIISDGMSVCSRKRPSISKEVPVPKSTLCSKPQRREIKFTKREGVAFGTCLCRINRGVYVTYVVRGSVAWSIGIQSGDRIDAVNDVFVYETGVTATEVLLLLRTGSSFHITVCDLPLSTAYVLTKDMGCADLGLVYSNGQISDFNPMSAMANAGVVRGESIVAVDNSCVLGYSDKSLQQLIETKCNAKPSVSILCMPTRFVTELQHQWNRYNSMYHTVRFNTEGVLLRMNNGIPDSSPGTSAPYFF